MSARIQCSGDVPAAFRDVRRLIAAFRSVDDPARGEALVSRNPFWAVDWDFVLALARATPVAPAGEALRGSPWAP
jgi:hypothetical protein